MYSIMDFFKVTDDLEDSRVLLLQMGFEKEAKKLKRILKKLDQKFEQDLEVESE